MATPIAQAGLKLHAWARRPEALLVPQLAQATPHDSALDLAAVADILAVCLSTDAVTLELAGSIIPVMSAGSVFACGAP